MELQETTPPDIIIRPSAIFALIKIVPLVFCCLGCLHLAWLFIPAFIWLSLAALCFAVYRYVYIRRTVYYITSEILSFSRGIFFKRTDTVELFRIKDYILTQSLVLQLFRLMNLILKTTDPENPVIWLRGIPFSDLTGTLRGRIIAARNHNRIYEIN